MDMIGSVVTFECCIILPYNQTEATFLGLHIRYRLLGSAMPISCRFLLRRIVSLSKFSIFFDRSCHRPSSKEIVLARASINNLRPFNVAQFVVQAAEQLAFGELKQDWIALESVWIWEYGAFKLPPMTSKEREFCQAGTGFTCDQWNWNVLYMLIDGYVERSVGAARRREMQYTDVVWFTCLPVMISTIELVSRRWTRERSRFCYSASNTLRVQMQEIPKRRV
jgi:hypothetical protein